MVRGKVWDWGGWGGEKRIGKFILQAGRTSRLRFVCCHKWTDLFCLALGNQSVPFFSKSSKQGCFFGVQPRGQTFQARWFWSETSVDLCLAYYVLFLWVQCSVPSCLSLFLDCLLGQLHCSVIAEQFFIPFLFLTLRPIDHGLILSTYVWK